MLTRRTILSLLLFGSAASARLPDQCVRVIREVVGNRVIDLRQVEGAVPDSEGRIRDKDIFGDDKSRLLIGVWESGKHVYLKVGSLRYHGGLKGLSRKKPNSNSVDQGLVFEVHGVPEAQIEKVREDIKNMPEDFSLSCARTACHLLKTHFGITVEGGTLLPRDVLMSLLDGKVKDANGNPVKLTLYKTGDNAKVADAIAGAKFQAWFSVMSHAAGVLVIGGPMGLWVWMLATHEADIEEKDWLDQVSRRWEKADADEVKRLRAALRAHDKLDQAWRRYLTRGFSENKNALNEQLSKQRAGLVRNWVEVENGLPVMVKDLLKWQLLPEKYKEDIKKPWDDTELELKKALN